jgi:hypothetical protein
LRLCGESGVCGRSLTICIASIFIKVSQSMLGRAADCRYAYSLAHETNTVYI